MKFDTLLKSKNVVFITEPSDLSNAFVRLFRLYPVDDICKFDKIGYYLLAPLINKKTVETDITTARTTAENLSHAINMPIGVVCGVTKGVSFNTTVDVDVLNPYPVEFRGKPQKKWDRWAITEEQVWQIVDMLIADPSATEVEETRAGRDTAMIVGLFFSGMRIGEFLAMRRYWMTLSDGVLTITVPLREGSFKCKTKNASRNIYVTDPSATDTLLSWYDEHPEGIGVADTWAWERCIAIGEQAGFEQRLTPHIFRHGAASWLAAKGMSPQFMMAQLGHSSAKISLEVYTHQTDKIPVELDKLNSQ